MTIASSQVTAVIINFQTPDLTATAVSSFRTSYSSVPLLLIDNGSSDGSAETFATLIERWPDTTSLIRNATNFHHGPAMDQAVRAARTPLVLFLDSDCEVLRGGFVEAMEQLLLEDHHNYVTGKRIWMNDRGFDVDETPGAHLYIRPICMMLRRNIYLTLPPFERHGAPCLANFVEASRHGLRLLHFPVESYVRHKGRGTAGRHGYHLGIRGRVNHLLNKLGL
jgi:glycosyltransferase involved in cell wall biosynthesis